MDYYECAIAGVTGTVGQKLTTYLDEHPFLKLTGIFASEKSAGKKFRDAIKGNEFFSQLDCEEPSKDILNMKVKDLDTLKRSSGKYGIIFSALDPDTAKRYEKLFARNSYVFTSASANRYDDYVPIHSISVNDSHLSLLSLQKSEYGTKGAICAKSNCTTSPIVSILSRIISKYGVKYVEVYTQQALSGAGKKGLDKNSEYRKDVEKRCILPNIEGEKEKVERESRDILGYLRKLNGKIIREPANFEIKASCNRIYRENVHWESMYIVTARDFDIQEIKNVIFSPEPSYVLPNFPEDSIVEWKGEVVPEDHVKKFGTMRTAVGNVKKSDKNELVLEVTSDNTGIGAGGGLVASAEYCILHNIITPNA